MRIRQFLILSTRNRKTKRRGTILPAGHSKRRTSAWATKSLSIMVSG